MFSPQRHQIWPLRKPSPHDGRGREDVMHKAREYEESREAGLGGRGRPGLGGIRSASDPSRLRRRRLHARSGKWHRQLN